MGASRYLDLVNEKVVVYDGAFGTYVQTLGLGPDDFGGDHFEGCNELLVVTRPDVIATMHDEFFKVGVDVVETATFGAFAVPLAEYGIAERSHEINLAAARIAREVADGHGGLVAGSMGPGTKFASLGQIRFAELRDAYEEQAAGLLEGGVDLLLVETQFDLLGAKAGMIGCRRAMAAAGREVPIQVQVTMELTGTMLPGTEIGAALAALDAMRPDVIGINCATGPAEMSEHLRYLGQHSRVPIACLPNAGLPSVVEGQMHYDLTPDQLAEFQSRFVRDFGVQVVGGCCGTTVEHIAALVDAVKDVTPAPRHFEHEDGATSIYSFTPFEQQLTYLSIGERTNANGSKKFREAMLEGDWDMCVAMAREQEKEGAHVLDVCVDYVGRDGSADMDEIASRFATQATVPLMIDSTEPKVIETALQWIGGRAILNSVNLEDGDAPGTRLDRFLSLAREYGAAVVCTCIDEEGQARTPEWKLKAAKAIHDIAVDRYGLEPGDLFFDPLALTLGTGMEESRGDGAATLEGIRLIKEHLPGVHTTLGLSNISFGLNPAARHVLNSVYLHEAAQAGLDSAIVHAARITPLARIPEEQKQVCLDVIYDRRTDDYDPLQELLSMFEGVKAGVVEKEDRSDWTIERVLSTRIIDGDRDGLTADLDVALEAGHKPLAIINDILLEGMKVVGDLFGKGEMQLPVRAAVGRDDEGGRRLPRADDGQGRRRVHQGPHRAGHGEGRRPRHRQEPRRHHPHQQRLRGAQPRHQGERVRDGRQGRRGEGRRHRHERPAREEHADHAREPRGAEHPRPGRDPGAPGRRRADARLRRARPPRGVRGPALLRQGRLRGPPRHGSHRLHQARRHRRRPRLGARPHRLHHRAPRPLREAGHRGGRADRPPRPLPRGGHRQRGVHAPVPREPRS